MRKQTMRKVVSELYPSDLPRPPSKRGKIFVDNWRRQQQLHQQYLQQQQNLRRQQEFQQAGERQRAAAARAQEQSAQWRKKFREAVDETNKLRNHRLAEDQKRWKYQIARWRKDQDKERPIGGVSGTATPDGPGDTTTFLPPRMDAWQLLAIVAGLMAGLQAFAAISAAEPTGPAAIILIGGALVGFVTYRVVNSDFVRRLVLGIIMLAAALAVIGLILYVIAQIAQHHGG